MIFSLPVGATSVLLEEPEHLVGQVQDVIVRSRLQGNLIVKQRFKTVQDFWPVNMTKKF